MQQEQPEKLVTRRCKACGAEMTWAEHVITRNRLPLVRWDPSSLPRPQVVYYLTEMMGQATAIKVDLSNVWVSHFETCSDPARFSRRGR